MRPRHFAWILATATACGGGAADIAARPAPSARTLDLSCPTVVPPAPARVRFRVSLANDAKQAAVSGRLVVAMSQAKDVDDPFGHDFDHPGDIWYAALDVPRLAASDPVELDPDILASPRPFSLAPAGSWRIAARLVKDGDPVLQGPVVERDLDPAHASIVDVRLDAAVPARPPPAETDAMKIVRVESPRLSAFYGRPIELEAIVQLPPGYDTDRTRRYATVYSINGWGSTLASSWDAHARLAKARAEQRYPEVVRVILPAMLPTGHHAFADSLENGPWGTALVEELIPQIEKQFRVVREARARLLTGHSSGGWSALWVQITHPAFFGGAWAVSPDPVDFRRVYGVDVTPGSTDNMYVTRNGEPRNLWRAGGRDVLSIEDFTRLDDVLDRRGALTSFDWVYSPRGPVGRPLPLFDHATGTLDPVVQRAWEKWDIRKVLSDGWATLGPSLEGKLHVFAGEEDTFHADEAVALLCDFLKGRDRRATCEVLPGKDHFNVYGSPVDHGSLRWRVDHEMGAAGRGL